MQSDFMKKQRVYDDTLDEPEMNQPVEQPYENLNRKQRRHAQAVERRAMK